MEFAFYPQAKNYNLLVIKMGAYKARGACSNGQKL